MEDITIGQIIAVIGVITALWVFTDKVIKAWNGALDNKLKPLVEEQQQLRKDVNMLGDVCYQMLSHMATNNNTGGMKKALDDYNQYNRHNN